jgi:hypothetical protein
MYGMFMQKGLADLISYVSKTCSEIERSASNMKVIDLLITRVGRYQSKKFLFRDKQNEDRKIATSWKRVQDWMAIQHEHPLNGPALILHELGTLAGVSQQDLKACIFPWSEEVSVDLTLAVHNILMAQVGESLKVVVMGHSLIPHAK